MGRSTAPRRHSWMQWLYRYPQAEYPYEQLRARERATAAATSASTSWPTPACWTTTGSSTSRSPTPRRRRTTSLIVDRGDQPRTRRRAAAPAAAGLVPQHLGVGTRRPHARAAPPRPAGAPRRRTCARSSASTVPRPLHRRCARAIPDVLVCDNETNAAALFGARRTRRPTRRTASTRASSTATSRRSTPPAPARRPRSGTASTRSRRARPCRCGCGSARPLPDEHTFGPGFDAVLADRAARGRRLLRRGAAAHAVRRGHRDRPARVRRPAVEQAALPLQRRATGSTATRASRRRRRNGPQPGARNVAWQHLALADVICMPDDWEYPWFAAWDLAFHCVALAHVDPAFAKEQLLLLCREWAMHPDGQLPGLRVGASATSTRPSTPGPPGRSTCVDAPCTASVTPTS